ncbi:polysaccharide deacetylase family protein [Streptomyces sp. MS1.AVA.1]|uniref:Polysaccharide deacetylase family protein n=1 Tax=Streptomyces machairae TaxID=3134109 RepID=A0ABU8UVE3_9ACTN
MWLSECRGNRATNQRPRSETVSPPQTITLKEGHRAADAGGMETRSLVVTRPRVGRRLIAVAAALFALLWGAVVPGPEVLAAGAVPSRPAAAADQEGLRALFGSENRLIRTDERVVAVTFNAAWNDAGLTGILGDLERRHAPATFFLTGTFADRHPRW